MKFAVTSPAEEHYPLLPPSLLPIAQGHFPARTAPRASPLTLECTVKVGAEAWEEAGTVSDDFNPPAPSGRLCCSVGESLTTAGWWPSDCARGLSGCDTLPAL